MIISALWLRTSSKFSGKKSKKQPEKLENRQLLSGCGFVQKIAPPLLFRDKRIKMEQNKTKRTTDYYLIVSAKILKPICLVTMRPIN